MSDELWIIRSNLTKKIIGCAHSPETAKTMAEHPRSRVTEGYTIERFVKAEAADEMAKITGLVQGPHGEWIEA